MAEFVTCPACNSTVLTADALLGRHVHCFSCGFHYLATPAPPAPPEPALRARPLPAPIGSKVVDSVDSRPYCPSCDRPVSREANECPHCGQEFEPESPLVDRLFANEPSLTVARQTGPFLASKVYASSIVGVVTSALW